MNDLKKWRHRGESVEKMRKRCILTLFNSGMRAVWMIANHGLDEIHFLDLMTFSIYKEKTRNLKVWSKRKLLSKTMKITIIGGRILNRSLPQNGIGI